MKKLLLLSLLFLFTSVAPAQDKGGLDVTLTDQSGAFIPGARVELFLDQPGTGVAASEVSDAVGMARFSALDPGEYRIRIAVEGFRVFEEIVSIESGKTTKIAVNLQIGQVTETVTVSGVVPPIQTSTSVRGNRKGANGAPPPPPPPAMAANIAGIIGIPASAEEYDHIAEGGFHSPAEDPLSTFSVDVDTASYSNVRRFLRDGRMPPADAVRIEELLNYFRYNDPAPEPDAEHPVRVTAELAVCPWKPEHKLARIALRSRALELENLPPSSLTFLLDVSGSMNAHDKLPLLKQGLAMLTRQLRPQDRVAIVVYAGAAGVVLDSTPASKTEEILAALERLHAGGSTAGAQGIQLAYKTARANFVKGGSNRVILATDGDFNVGVSSQGELVRLIKKERESGVFLTVLGFGTGNLADARMEQLADHGNGQYLYIDSVLEARRALVEQIGGTLATVAKDVKIQVEFNPTRVAQYRLIGYENRMLAAKDFEDDTKDAGEMGAGHSVVALYQIVPPGASASDDIELRYQKSSPTQDAKTSGELLTVKVRYKPPTEDESRLLSAPLLDAARPIEESGEDLRWAAAVAEYGMLLRDSEHKGSASWDSAAALARGALGEDRNGARAELASLIRTAQTLAASKSE